MYRALYGDSALSLMHWALELLRFNIAVLLLIACEELNHLGVPGKMMMCILHYGGCTSRVVDAWVHVG